MSGCSPVAIVGATWGQPAGWWALQAALSSTDTVSLSVFTTYTVCVRGLLPPGPSDRPVITVGFALWQLARLTALHVAALISETVPSRLFQAYTVPAAIVTPNGVSPTVAVGERQPSWRAALQVAVFISETVVPPWPVFPPDPPGPLSGTYSVCLAWSRAERLGPLPTATTAGVWPQPSVRVALHAVVSISETVLS